MRLYTFTNFYLSSLQKGLQTAHVVSELFVKYRPTEWNGYKAPTPAEDLRDWAANHRTIIIKDGGNHQNLKLMMKMLFKASIAGENPYAWVAVAEDGPSLNRATTAVGIILPPKFYETFKAEPPPMTDWEATIKHRLVKGMPLAH